MHDKNYIRNNPEEFNKHLHLRKSDWAVKDLLRLDEEEREFQTQDQTIRARINEISKLIPIAKKNNEDVSHFLLESLSLKDSLREMHEKHFGDSFDEALREIPNILDESVPEGNGEQENVMWSNYGISSYFGFQPKDHATLAENLGMIDFEDWLIELDQLAVDYAYQNFNKFNQPAPGEFSKAIGLDECRAAYEDGDSPLDFFERD